MGRPEKGACIGSLAKISAKPQPDIKTIVDDIMYTESIFSTCHSIKMRNKILGQTNSVTSPVRSVRSGHSGNFWTDL